LGKNTVVTRVLRGRLGVKNIGKSATRRSTTLWLPFPISTNQIWDYGKARVFTSTAYKRWIADADSAYLQQKRGLPKDPIEGKFAASIILDVERFGSMDGDNGVKCILDFISKRVQLVSNDKNLWSLTLGWGSAPNGCTIQVVEIPDA
jgi:hypothetical protein